MPTYVTLYKWTEQGAKTSKETVSRAEQVIAAAQKMGGRITQLLWTQGRYDVIAISEWPDEESAQAFTLQVGAMGSVRSETLRAFTKDDVKRFLTKLT